MGIHTHKSTMPGGMTPICNDCGISLCWDVDESEAETNAEFWNQWVCRDCNGGTPMSFHVWQTQQRKV